MTASQWFEVATSYSLQVFVVIAVCTAIERIVVRTSDRCRLWSTCFVCILFLGCAALALPRLHLIQPWSQLRPQTLVSVSAAQNVLGRLLLAVWCLGASIAVIRWMVRGHQLRQMLRTCEPMTREDVERLLGRANVAARDNELPAVLISDESAGPFCWQLHRPTIVLPRFLLEGNNEDLRHVLLHELEHLTTKHPLQLFWQHLVQVICWFHPAVWKAATRASLMREFTCDEAAAESGADSAAYLRTLLHIAERCDRHRNTSAVGFGRSTSEIILRARRLVDLARLDPSQANGARIGCKSAISLLLGFTILTSLIWIPSDPLASPRSIWSPWPNWSARAAHCFGWNLRDYEQYDRRSQLFEILRDACKDISAYSNASTTPSEQVGLRESS
jgi:bla regulator protein blaR1